MELVRYRNPVFDSARWDGFAFRSDDIVVDTPPKSGTTWTQTLCAMVVFGTDRFDRPMSEISPWLDMQTAPLIEVVGLLDAQHHRRIIKTHTPLDGLPRADGVTVVCVGRDPRDVAMSFEHHWANLDTDRLMAVRARAVGMQDLAELPALPALPEDPAARFQAWIEATGPFPGPTLADIAQHLTTFWERRHEPGVALFHYQDLLSDLPGQIRRLADVLEVERSDDEIEHFARAATFDRMRERAAELAPNTDIQLWKSTTDFFHVGSSGQWRAVADAETSARYQERVSELMAPDLAAWAHHGWLGMEEGLTDRLTNGRRSGAHLQVQRPAGG